MGNNIINDLLSAIRFAFRFFLMIFLLILKFFKIFQDLIISEELRSKLSLFVGKEGFSFIFLKSDVIFALKNSSNLLFVAIIVTVLIEDGFFYFIFGLGGLFDFVFWHLFLWRQL